MSSTFAALPIKVSRTNVRRHRAGHAAYFSFRLYFPFAYLAYFVVNELCPSMGKSSSDKNSHASDNRSGNAALPGSGPSSRF
jgi:hypothetical protein